MSILPTSRRARIATGLAALPLLLGIVFLTAYVVVQSSSFKGYLSRNLTSILGEHIDIGQDIQVTRVFPRLTLMLPNVKIRPTSLGNNVERVRVDGFTLAVSPKVLLSAGEKGIIDIHVKEATLLSATSSLPSPSTKPSIAQSTQIDGQSVDANQASVTAVPGSAGAETSIAQTLNALLQSSSTLHSSLATDRLVYIARDAESGSVRYDITQLSLEVRDQKTRLTAMVDTEGQPQRSVNASFNAIDPSDAQNDHSLKAELSIDMTTASVEAEESADKPAADDSHTFSTPVQITDNHIELGPLEYQSAVGWVRGNIGADMGNEQIRIEADLEIRKLQLSSARQSDIRAADSAAEAASRLFPYKPFSFHIPEHIEAQARIYLGAIRLDSTPIINGELQLSISGGEAQLETKNLTLLGGPSELSVSFTNPEYGFSSVLMKLEADDIQLNRIRTPETGEPILSRGKADLIMALRGSGPSPGHIAASSNGYVIATVDSAEINQKYTTAIDRGVVSWGLDRIAVMTSDSESERALTRLSDPLFVPCASMKLYLNDGRAEVSNGFIIEFPQNTLYSSGFINLYDEKMGFAFRARNKSLFDWSAISIARFAEVSGTLVNPSVTLNKNELAKQGILSTSSIVWGPLPSLVYSLAESGLKNSKSKQCRKSIE